MKSKFALAVLASVALILPVSVSGVLPKGIFGSLTNTAQAAGKYDKKLEKKLKRAIGAVSQLTDSATGSEPAISAATEAIAEFGKMNHPKAASFLIKIGLIPLKSPAAEVAVFDAVKSALSGMDDAEARKSIYKTLKKKRDWRIQITLIDVIKNFNDDESQFLLHELLEAKKIDERVVAEVARALASRKDKRGVRPLIKAFGKYKKVGGVTFKAITDALYEITGKKFDEVQDWESFWDPRETTFDPNTAKKDDISGTVERGKPKLFGSEVVSKKVVIIIDVSGSMAIKDPGGNEEGEEGEDMGDGTQERKKKKKKNPNAAPPYNGPSLQPGSPDYNKLPASRMRIERAKVQLRRLVNAFQRDARFNIVKFSTQAGAWKPKQILPAVPNNKKDAIKFIENLKASGVTNAYKSLTTAFECQQADTIYFISDGSPTDDQGQPLNGAAVDGLIAKIKQLNKFRKVKINTIGLKGSSPSFMRRLASLTGGKYKQVD